MTEQGATTLVVLMDGQTAGQLTEDDGGRLTFTYEPGWQGRAGATPLSLSMPLDTRSHGDEVVRAFLRGLLPDDDQVLERWARTYAVSPQSPVALLGHVGEDCAGAVQFAAPDRVDDLLADADAHTDAGGDAAADAETGRAAGDVEWLDDAQVAEHLRTLRVDPAAWHATPTGRFTLAGARAKTALHQDVDGDRWGIPRGPTPTTHVLTPAARDLGRDLNQHLCLETARHLELPAVRSHVLSFEGEPAIVVERYDRRRLQDGRVVRLHQEDVAQALGLPPSARYQDDRGPAPERIVRLLESEIQPVHVSEESVDRFVDALALHWILGGTDAHARTYALLLAGRRVRLAPLHHVVSVLPYRPVHLSRVKMAMRIGGEPRLGRMHRRHWRRLAERLGLHPDRVVARVHDLAAGVPEQLAVAASAEPVQALETDLPGRLVDTVTAWAARCRQALS